MRPGVKQDQVIASLEEGIIDGTYPTGSKLPSEHTLRERFGFSRVTIRGALQTLKTRGLVESIHGSGNYVKAVARHLPLSLANDEVCLVMRELASHVFSDPYLQSILDGVRSALQRDDQALSMVSMPQGKNLISQWGNKSSTLAKNVLLLNYELTAEEAAWLIDNQFRVVSIGAQQQVTSISTVEIDNQFGGHLATKHLLDQGISNIRFLGISPGNSHGDHRYEGYCRALNERGMVSGRAPIVPVIPWEEDSGYAAMDALIKEETLPEGILVHGDRATLGVVKRLTEAELTLGKDIKLVMYDNFEWVQAKFPTPVTAVHQPFADTGRVAVELFTHMTDVVGGRVFERVLMPSLVVRESSL